MRKCPSPTGFFKVDNLFGELWSEAQKSIARKNLGVSDDDSLFWGNIKGFIENQDDIREFIYKTSDAKVKSEIAKFLEISPETIELVRQLSQWMVTDTTGAAALVQEVTANSESIKQLQQQTQYLTQEEYDKLVADDLVKDNVEYNIYESE